MLMLNNLKILFLFMTMFGTIMSFSSMNWFSAWMGLEINMISFIPLLLNNKNIMSTESAMNYFLIQASASSMFMFFCIFNSMNNFSHMFFIESFNFLLILLPLLMKLGSAPFHNWFITIMKGLDWLNCYLLLTLQKAAPLFMLFFLSKSKLILIFSFLSVMIGSIGGLNQTSLKKIMAFSSINHLGWMLISLNLTKYLMINYFLFYLLMNLFVISFTNDSHLTQFNQSMSFLDISSWSISILSLGGLPPFLGFMPKWMILQNLILNNNFMLAFVLIATALITLLYYLRLIYKSLIMNSISQKWVKPLSNKFLYKMTLIMITSLGLIIFNLILI